MRTLLVAAAAAIALSMPGCAQLDGFLQQTLPGLCKDAEADHRTFLAIAATGLLKPSTIAREKATHDGISAICADPEHTGVADAIAKVAVAYQTIEAELKAAKGDEVVP